MPRQQRSLYPHRVRFSVRCSFHQPVLSLAQGRHRLLRWGEDGLRRRQAVTPWCTVAYPL